MGFPFVRTSPSAGRRIPLDITIGNPNCADDAIDEPLATVLAQPTQHDAAGTRSVHQLPRSSVQRVAHEPRSRASGDSVPAHGVGSMRLLDGAH